MNKYNKVVKHGEFFVTVFICKGNDIVDRKFFDNKGFWGAFLAGLKMNNEQLAKSYKQAHEWADSRLVIINRETVE